MPRKSTQPRYQRVYKGICIDVTAPTQAELEEKVRKKKNAIDDGEVVGSKAGTSVAAWSDVWLSEYKEPNVVQKSAELYETLLRLHILPAIGKLKLQDVRPVDLQKILNAQRGKSKSHALHIKNTLTGMFREAYRNKLIPYDPAADLTVPDGLTESGHRALTDAEAELFLKACEGSRYGAAFLLQYYAGLRPCEVVALRHGDIDDKYIHIKKTKNTKKKKDPAGLRDVPIVDALRPTTDKLRKGPSGELIFKTENGRPLTGEYLAHRWKSILNLMDVAAGADVINNKVTEQLVDHTLSQYDLRHTFCTNLERAGVPINVARRLMGHESVEMTAKIYTHKSDDVLQNALKLMNLHCSKEEFGQELF